MALEKIVETIDVSKVEKNDFKEIKPQTGMTLDKAKDFVKSFFEGMKQMGESNEWNESLKELKEKYIEELKEFSEFEKTLPDKFFDINDLKKVSPEENRILREEFDESKSALKKQWEELHGMPWPKYEKDVYIITKSGERIRIREAGMDMDAHHIQPICIGGKNEASNITPLHAEVHFDHKGIHRLEGACDNLKNKVRGEAN